MASYEKQTWTDKITDVTAERMNHIEKGIEDAGKTGGVLDGTIVEWEEDEIPEGYEEVEEYNKYSTEEYFTGKYWIDGKKIYGKVVDLGLVPSTSTITSYTIGANIEELIDYRGKLVNENISGVLPTISGEYRAEISVYSVKPIIQIDLIRTVAGAWTDRNFVLTVEYTKTTD